MRHPRKKVKKINTLWSFSITKPSRKIHSHKPVQNVSQQNPLSPQFPPPQLRNAVQESSDLPPDVLEMLRARAYALAKLTFDLKKADFYNWCNDYTEQHFRDYSISKIFEQSPVFASVTSEGICGFYFGPDLGESIPLDDNVEAVLRKSLCGGSICTSDRRPTALEHDHVHRFVSEGTFFEITMEDTLNPFPRIVPQKRTGPFPHLSHDTFHGDVTKELPLKNNQGTLSIQELNADLMRTLYMAVGYALETYGDHAIEDAALFVLGFIQNDPTLSLLKFNDNPKIKMPIPYLNSSELYYYIQNSSQCMGPFHWNHLRKMVVTGQFTKESWVWRSHTGTWAQAKHIEALRVLFAKNQHHP